MLNSVILMGRLTADPELRQTQNGTSVTSVHGSSRPPFSERADRLYQRCRMETDRRVCRKVFQKRCNDSASRQYSAAQL